MTASFNKSELQIEDIEGIFVNEEVSAAFFAGGAWNVLMLGIGSADFLQDLLFSPIHFPGDPGFTPHTTSMASAALRMGGMFQGPAVGVNAMGYVGYLYSSDASAEAAILDLKYIENVLSTKVQGTRHEDAPPIILPGDVLFDFDKYVLKPGAKTALENAGIMIKFFPGRHFLIQGFADGIGGKGRHNQELSENRAAAVMDWLIKKGFVRSSNISSVGYGVDYPVATNSTAAGRAKNRRVEVHILSRRPVRILRRSW
jgi:outer membrane protein OmpA-like peptidoglycan-associated protein